jgi:hypothetical protein
LYEGGRVFGEESLRWLGRKGEGWVKEAQSLVEGGVWLGRMKGVWVFGWIRRGVGYKVGWHIDPSDAHVCNTSLLIKCIACVSVYRTNIMCSVRILLNDAENFPFGDFQVFSIIRNLTILCYFSIYF